MFPIKLDKKLSTKHILIMTHFQQMQNEYRTTHPSIHHQRNPLRATHTTSHSLRAPALT